MSYEDTPNFEQLIERVIALEEKSLKLEDLPMRQLQDKLELEWLPDVQTVDREEWQALPFNTNWTSFGAGWPAGQFRKDTAGFVHIRGLVKTTVAYGYGAPTATIATLPAGYRPATDVMYMCPQQDSAAAKSILRVHVRSSGVIDITEAIYSAGNNGSAVWLSLDTITPFRTD